MPVVSAWKTLTPGIEIPKSITLFPRVELKTEATGETMNEMSHGLNPALKPEIAIEEFGAMDLRVATIVKAEIIPRAKKLLKLDVDMGEPQLRTVVAGIAKAYSPEDLLNKQVVIVANLKPAKLMGVRSQGMVLAASGEEEPVVLTLDKLMPPGTPVR